MTKKSITSTLYTRGGLVCTDLKPAVGYLVMLFKPAVGYTCPLLNPWWVDFHSLYYPTVAFTLYFAFYKQYFTQHYALAIAGFVCNLVCVLYKYHFCNETTQNTDINKKIDINKKEISYKN